MVRQEIRAFLLTHYAIRRLMLDHNRPRQLIMLGRHGDFSLFLDAHDRDHDGGVSQWKQLSWSVAR